MQGPHLRKYGVETTIDFVLFETDGIDFKVDAVHASGDTVIMKDEAAETSTSNSFTDEGQGYSIVITATEMEAARVVVYIVDQGTKAWLDTAFVVETYGNASAMHAFDLDTATQGVNVTQISGDSPAADNAEAFFDGTGYAGTNNVIPTVTTLTGHTAQTGDNYARIGAPAGASVSADVAAVKAETVLIVADTNELQTDDVPALIAALPTAAENRTEMDSNSTQLAAIVADTDELQTDDVPGLIAALNDPSAADVADAVWDELSTGHTDAGKAGQQLWTDIDAILADTDELQADDIPASIAALPTAVENRTEMDSNSTQLAAIVADTDELQTDDVPGLIAALNDVSTAEVNAEVDTALTDIHLDHLLATDYDPASKPGVATALLNEMVESDVGVSRFTANALEQGPGGSAPTVEQIRTEMDSNSTQLAAIVADTNELQTDDVPGLIAALNDVSTAEVNTEVDTALADINLDHLVGTATGIPAIVAGTYIDQIMDDGTATYDRTTDSLQAIRDRGDTSWITGGGGGITQILNVQPLIPESIDLANTATWRLGLALINSLDDLPTTAEITPGTIDIDRKAAGGTSWSSVVSGAACSESAGQVYYDEVFDSGTGYAEGDSIRVTFMSISITADANTHEVCDATGIVYYTEVRSTSTIAAILADTNELQTDDVPTLIAALPTAVENRTEMDSNSTQLAAIVADTNELQTDNIPGTLSTMDGKLDSVETDTQDIQARLPAALVSGKMDSDMVAISGDTTAADNLESDFDGTGYTYTYQAKVWLVDDDGGSTDRYVTAWYRNAEPIVAGITSPQIQVIKASDGTDLVGATAMTQIGATGLYRYDEASNRVVDGAAYMAKVTATIGGSTRTWYQPVGRDG
jgi:hypothetical protein